MVSFKKVKTYKTIGNNIKNKMYYFFANMLFCNDTSHKLCKKNMLKKVQTF